MADTVSPEAAEEFLVALHALSRRVRRLGPDAALAPGQFRMLRVLQETGRPMRLGELACALGVAPRSVTSKVDAAERDGLVRRLADPADRRATRVELTGGGVLATDRVHSERAEAAALVLGELEPDERAELVRLLALAAGDEGPAAPAG